MKKLPIIISLLFFLVISCNREKTDSIIYTSTQNPVFPDSSKLYIPDPEPKLFDDRIYVYGSLDAEGGELPSGIDWCSDHYRVVHTHDLIHWQDAGISFHLDSIPEKFLNTSQTRLWAPDVLKNPADGKYYLFLCTNGKSDMKIFVAVSDHPEGPFQDAVPLLIDGKIPIGEIDPGVLLDNDGKAYVTWPFKIAQLDPNDYSNVLGNTIVDVNQWMPEDNPPFEGPSLRKRGDLYYYIYIQNDGLREFQSSEGKTSPTRMAYMTSENPLGPYNYQGLIIETTDYPSARNVHGSFVEFKKDWYLFYHLPVIDIRFTRTMCIERLSFNSDGTIKPIVITSSGVNGPFRPGDKIKAGSAVVWPDEEMRTEFISRESKGPVIVFKKGGSWVGYRYIELLNNPEAQIEGSFRTIGTTCRMEIRLNSPDGPAISSFNIPDTDGAWETITSKIDGTYQGIYTFYIKMVENSGDGSIELEWIRF